MTTQISTELITHWAYIEKEDKKFPLTSDQAFSLRELLMQSTTTKYIMIPNPREPLGEPLWEGRAWSVIIKKVEVRADPDAYYVCDFGIKHAIQETCTDTNKFKIPPIVFRTALRELYPNIKYPRQVTPEIRNRILASFN